MPAQRKLIPTLLLLAALATAAPAFAQEGTSVSFGGLQGDTTLPVEVKADTLEVDQSTGQALFSGNVLVTQGEMRLTAARIRVEYSEADNQIARLHADGRVLLVNAKDAAEADQAVYTIATGEVVMTGNVLLTQGPATMSAGSLTISLKTGLGRLSGGVTTTFLPQDGN